MAGNLVRTIPPKGARPDFSSTFIASVEAARISGSIVRPAHLFPTDYRYNSLNEVVVQQTPDAGLSQFWYDILGRLVVSQQAQQYQDNKFSYTLYDPLGRITEVGQKPQSTAMDQTTSQNPTALAAWIGASTGAKEQITATVYDIPSGSSLQPLMTQQNLRNRVSYTHTWNFETDATWYTGSYYTYDIHGNVDTLLQDYIGVSAMGTGVANQYKQICYNYDLISGKVNGVDYQPGNGDAFYHRYQYDAENRLVQVWTSRDSIVWERDAAYSYYKHGPLSRTVLGMLQPQGLDYTYTLQGWLKGVNIGSGAGGSGDNSGASCPAGSAVNDAVIGSRTATSDPVLYSARTSITFAGEFSSLDNDAFETTIDNTLTACTTGTGTTQPAGTEAYPVGQDAYNFSLHYYPGDYLPVGSTVPVRGILEALPTQTAPLFNGNIAAMAVDVPTLGDPKVYAYHYDPLNRLSQMDAFKGLTTSTNTFTPETTDDYKERVNYDPNGNILGYNRNGTAAGSSLLAMDNLTYNYISGTNKLSSINDAVASTNYAVDIDDQGANNYTYDKIGSLTGDAASGITNISWTVYGKIASITNSSGTINYTYDAAGNRLTKTAGNTTTVYVRDAQGNVLSVYQKVGSAAIQQTETHLYGSSRLGLVKALTVIPQSITLSGGLAPATLSTFTRGEKLYELGNHLGNVLATISDKKIAVSSTTNSSLIDSYKPDVANAQDYYPFGMQMPGRTYTEAGGSNYRYGFNGKENDNEVKKDANGNALAGSQIDYGMRVYDPRVGKFLSVDPLTKKFPHLTPYQYASNTPVQATDLDGGESRNVNTDEVDNTLNPGSVSKYQNNKDYSPWKDLIRLKPSESTLKNAGDRVSWLRLQKIEDAAGKELNVDYYSLTIGVLPPAFKSPEQLLSYFRHNISKFIEGSKTEFEEYNATEGRIWNSNTPLTSVMRFQINNPVYNLDDASVITSKYSSNNWVFSPVFTLYDFGHPVSGNRQFGVTTNDNGTYTFFIRGADRIHSGTDVDLGGQKVYDGADKLWNATMSNFSKYINSNGGGATINPRVWKRVEWDKNILKK